MKIVSIKEKRIKTHEKEILNFLDKLSFAIALKIVTCSNKNE